jgi:hypothetical protein
MREKKYTKTIAVRVTQEEWELIEFAMIRDGLKNPTKFLRKELELAFRVLRQSVIQAEKRREAAERRAAKKAAADVNA